MATNYEKVEYKDGLPPTLNAYRLNKNENYLKGLQTGDTVVAIANKANIWDASVTYNVNDIVSKQGRLYVAQSTNVAVDPTTDSGSIWAQYLAYAAPIAPIGFVYFQLPLQSDPSALYPNTTWTNISATYAGAFFRAEGGNATAFGSSLTISTATTTVLTFSTVHGLMIGSPISFNGQTRNVSVVNSSTQITVGVAFSTIPNGTVLIGQFDQLLDHAHSSFSGDGQNWDDNAGGSGYLYQANGAWRNTSSPSARYGSENRPANYSIRVWKRIA